MRAATATRALPWVRAMVRPAANRACAAATGGGRYRPCGPPPRACVLSLDTRTSRSPSGPAVGHYRQPGPVPTRELASVTEVVGPAVPVDRCSSLGVRLRGPRLDPGRDRLGPVACGGPAGVLDEGHYPVGEVDLGHPVAGPGPAVTTLQSPNRRGPTSAAATVDHYRLAGNCGAASAESGLGWAVGGMSAASSTDLPVSARRDARSPPSST
jgi:hypothetical protein